MENQCSSFDIVTKIWWATVWFATIGSWPAMASAAPLERRQQDDSSPQSQQQQQQQPMSQTSQGLIAGLAAGVAVAVLTGITLVICYPPRKWARRKSTRPIKPWIQQTTTTTVTSHSRSGDSESTDSLTESAAPLPMTRITNIDKRGRYIISKEAAANAESDVAGPSSRRPPASLQRYSVHVTSNGNGATSSKGSVALPSLPEDNGSVASFLTSETITPVTTMNWPINAVVVPSASNSSPASGKSIIADRRGRPALQSIQVPSPSSPASVKGKGKARLYYH
ncbi:hypothetical protein N0V93_006883 [Gnomoniopsis smithogilvyi]|uniref:Uncharacterized protein n=1 Tax=Gnomoniopsis smithogilvyi TaxID=1191159 RepID=A0A9W8YSR1_9PEZI|nr:hypothetical protein N0V93_006883 [Gnomoniopsis smithogilvyi]